MMQRCHFAIDIVNTCTELQPTQIMYGFGTSVHTIAHIFCTGTNRTCHDTRYRTTAPEKCVGLIEAFLSEHQRFSCTSMNEDVELHHEDRSIEQVLT